MSVLFIPYTVEGELARRLKAAEADQSKLIKDKVKIVEETGQTMTSLLTKADPSTASCGREQCVVCKDEKQRGKCKARSVTYQTSCNACTAKGKEAIYIGESSRSVFERSLEHLEDFKKEKDNSHMFSHTTEAHSLEEKPNFNIKVLKIHRSALYRQVHEAVMIARHQPVALNSKLEYNRCLLPRLTVMLGQKNIEDIDKSEVAGEKPGEEEKTLAVDGKRKKHRTPNLKRKRRKLETLKHKKIEEIMRSHQEKSPRKRRRSSEDENNPSPFKSPRYFGGAKADHLVIEADPSSAKFNQSLIKADPSSVKSDPSSVKKSNTKSTPARKTTRTPARKCIQAKKSHLKCQKCRNEHQTLFHILKTYQKAIQT